MGVELAEESWEALWGLGLGVGVGVGRSVGTESDLKYPFPECAAQTDPIQRFLLWRHFY